MIFRYPGFDLDHPPLRIRQTYGIETVWFPGDPSYGIEVQYAPDSAGAPNVGAAVTLDVLPPGVTHFRHYTPNDGARRHYRARAVGFGDDPSGYTDWINAKPQDLSRADIAAVNSNLSQSGQILGPMFPFGYATKASSVLPTAQVIGLDISFDSSFATGSYGIVQMYGRQLVATTGSLQNRGHVVSGHSSGTVVLLIGMQGIAQVDTNFAVTAARGIQGVALQSSASGTLTDAVGGFFSVVRTGFGPITNAYGVWVDPITAGTNNWAIKTGSGLVDLGDTLLTIASSTTKAGLRIPEGAAPSVPLNGEVWMTSAGLYYQANGIVFGPLT